MGEGRQIAILFYHDVRRFSASPRMEGANRQQLDRYDACSSTLQFIVDTHPHLGLSLVPIPLVYPLSHDEVIETTKRTIAQENDKANGRIRLALFDAISR
jgi:hypothetical protein